MVTSFRKAEHGKIQRCFSHAWAKTLFQWFGKSEGLGKLPTCFKIKPEDRATASVLDTY